MTVYRFDLTVWFAASRQREFEWDCDSYDLYLLPDGKVEKHWNNGSETHRQQARARHPGAVHLGKLHHLQGRLEVSASTETLRKKYPEVHEALGAALGGWEEKEGEPPHD